MIVRAKDGCYIICHLPLILQCTDKISNDEKASMRTIRFLVESVECVNVFLTVQPNLRSVFLNFRSIPFAVYVASLLCKPVGDA